MEDNHKRKIAIIGDSEAGKDVFTTALITGSATADILFMYGFFTQSGWFNPDIPPDVLDSTSAHKVFGASNVLDNSSSGQEEKEKRIQLELEFFILPCYMYATPYHISFKEGLENVDLVVLHCNSTEPESLESVIHKWFPIVCYFLPSAPIILFEAGPYFHWEMLEKSRITEQQIRAAASVIGAIYTERCPNLNDPKVQERIKEVIAWCAFKARQGVEAKKRKEAEAKVKAKAKRRCIIM